MARMDNGHVGCESHLLLLGPPFKCTFLTDAMGEHEELRKDADFYTRGDS